MGNQAIIEAFWRGYLSSLPAGQRPANERLPEAWSFGTGAEMADQLGRLVYDGVKTATCSLLWSYEAEGEALPQVGDLSIILDGEANPLCIIETTDIRIKPFNQVDDQFAYDEGEGDRSLANWRAGHWNFFTGECKALGQQPSEAMPVVCERLRVIYRSAEKYT